MTLACIAMCGADIRKGRVYRDIQRKKAVPAEDAGTALQRAMRRERRQGKNQTYSSIFHSSSVFISVRKLAPIFMIFLPSAA